MTTLTIHIPDSKATELRKYLKSIGAKIETIKPVKATKKSGVLKDIETGLKQVKAYQAGKGKMYTLDEVLNGK